MIIPKTEIKSDGSDDHPIGDFSAKIGQCAGKMSDENGFEIRIVFNTAVGRITQFWNTRVTGWKIGILRDALGIEGNLDTDAITGMNLDLRVTRKPSKDGERSYINVETHVHGTLVRGEQSHGVSATAGTPPDEAPF
jgi:hypothetical protein